MMKFFALTLLSINSLFASIDANGWALVEHPKKNGAAEVLHEEDPSVWVVFAKQLGSEKFLIRFPEDPSYTYITPDEMEIASGRHLLRISTPQPLEERMRQLEANPDILLIEAQRPAPNTLDLFYQLDEKWVWERLFLTPCHLYVLQTTSDILLEEPHEKFVDSLDVEPHP